ncbi:replicative DNA helicase [Candidatus Uhrbacteria bacterium]|nr:replicative DNA helicase [Candidatus Uhrbacteria bacterium]
MSSGMTRVPPHNLEAEESLLGAVLIDQETLLKIGDLVKPEDFYKDSHRIIFETMLELAERHDPIDILTVGNRLEEKSILKQVGGRTALVELTNTVTTAAHVAHYAEIITKKALLRRLLRAASDITELGYDETQDADLLIDEAEQKLFNVSSNVHKTSFVPLRSVLTQAFDRIDELHREKGKLRGVPTGFTGLDNLLAGLQKSDLVILAARPSVGKTSFALDIMRSVALRTKQPVGFFSLEMSKEQLVDRLICAEAGVDLWKLRNGRLSDHSADFHRIGDALGKLSEAPIYIDDSPMANIMTVRTKARRLQSEHGLSLIVVDYLQLMEARKQTDNRVQEVAEISRGLKQIARELQVPVLALAQLSRAVENEKPAIPKLAHLRDSGSIEQDADVVMFLYRKAADRNYQPDELTPEEKNAAEVHVAKHRNGPTGMVKLFWDAARTSFKNLDKAYGEMPVPIAAGGAKPPADATATLPSHPATPPANPNVGLPPGMPPRGFTPPPR